MSFDPSPASVTTARTTKRIGLIVAVVVAVVVLAGAAIVGLVLVVMASDRPLSVTAADRALLVTAEDMVPWIEGFEPVPGVENVMKREELGGAVQLEYVYDRSDDGMYVWTSITTARTPRLARTTYASLRVGHGIGLSLSGN